MRTKFDITSEEITDTLLKSGLTPLEMIALLELTKLSVYDVINEKKQEGNLNQGVDSESTAN